MWALPLRWVGYLEVAEGFGFCIGRDVYRPSIVEYLDMHVPLTLVRRSIALLFGQIGPFASPSSLPLGYRKNPGCRKVAGEAVGGSIGICRKLPVMDSEHNPVAALEVAFPFPVVEVLRCGVVVRAVVFHSDLASLSCDNKVKNEPAAASRGWHLGSNCIPASCQPVEQTLLTKGVERLHSVSLGDQCGDPWGKTGFPLKVLLYGVV
jgi:hypothetical protein